MMEDTLKLKKPRRQTGITFTKKTFSAMIISVTTLCYGKCSSHSLVYKEGVLGNRIFDIGLFFYKFESRSFGVSPKYNWEENIAAWQKELLFSSIRGIVTKMQKKPKYGYFKC